VEIKIEANTVVANEGGFEPHPESYTPRVFAKVPDAYLPDVYKIYEIFGNGQAMEWPTLPPADCGFDYWSFLLMNLGNVTMVRAARSVPQADGYSELGTPSWIGEIDGKRYRGLGNPESSPLSHLPEGSH